MTPEWEMSSCTSTEVNTGRELRLDLIVAKVTNHVRSMITHDRTLRIQEPPGNYFTDVGCGPAQCVCTSHLLQHCILVRLKGMIRSEFVLALTAFARILRQRTAHYLRCRQCQGRGKSTRGQHQCHALGLPLSPLPLQQRHQS